MTRDEAIERLNIHKSTSVFVDSIAEAIDMAIEALQDRPQGKWIDKGQYAVCSNCGADSGTQFDGVQPVPRKTSFCPNCGADMRGEKE